MSLLISKIVKKWIFYSQTESQIFEQNINQWTSLFLNPKLYRKFEFYQKSKIVSNNVWVFLVAKVEWYHHCTIPCWKESESLFWTICFSFARLTYLCSSASHVAFFFLNLLYSLLWCQTMNIACLYVFCLSTSWFINHDNNKCISI